MNNKFNPVTGKYTFDEWASLSQNDPKKFELERKKMIDSFIEEAPEENRLELQQLQFKIEGVRRKYKKNALVSTQKVFTEMWSCFSDLNQLLQYAGSNNVPLKFKPKLSIVDDK